MRLTFVVVMFSLAALPAWAFERIESRSAFVDTVSGKSLRYAPLGVRLLVRPDGSITGSAALGTKVTGSWEWSGGFFCRDLAWSRRSLPRNCQVVERAGDKLRFTADRGQGDAAVFRIR